MTDETKSRQRPSKPPRKTAFDQTARDALRAAIPRYARENGIGAPALQVRIAQITKRSPDQLPLKTLQRFLGNIGRTNDGFLIPCFEFAEAVGETGPHDELARDLGEFFSRGEIEERPADEVPERLAGQYEVWAGAGTFINFKVRTAAEGELNPDERYGRCRLSGSGRGLKVHEEEAGPGSDGTAGEFRQAANEGMMLFFEPLVFILLKNRLTRLPRVYWLREHPDGKLLGHAMQGDPAQSGGEVIPYSRLRNFELRRTAKGAS
jgi:hypothetical protein